MTFVLKNPRNLPTHRRLTCFGVVGFRYGGRSKTLMYLKLSQMQLFLGADGTVQAIMPKAAETKSLPTRMVTSNGKESYDRPLVRSPPPLACAVDLLLHQMATRPRGENEEDSYVFAAHDKNGVGLTNEPCGRNYETKVAKHFLAILNRRVGWRGISRVNVNSRVAQSGVTRAVAVP